MYFITSCKNLTSTDEYTCTRWKQASLNASTAHILTWFTMKDCHHFWERWHCRQLDKTDKLHLPAALSSAEYWSHPYPRGAASLAAGQFCSLTVREVHYFQTFSPSPPLLHPLSKNRTQSFAPLSWRTAARVSDYLSVSLPAPFVTDLAGRIGKKSVWLP